MPAGEIAVMVITVAAVVATRNHAIGVVLGSITALDAIETKYARRGKTVEITGLNTRSARLHGRLSGELTAGH